MLIPMAIAFLLYTNAVIYARKLDSLHAFFLFSELLEIYLVLCAAGRAFPEVDIVDCVTYGYELDYH